MDGSGSIPGAYPSISAAAGIANPGDTIRVQGLNSGGTPIAYSDDPVLVTQSPESFPIVLPHGITILANDAVPVYVAASLIAPAALIRIAGTSTDSTVSTLIRKLNLIGGLVGLDLDETSGSGFKLVTVREVHFMRNVVGLSAIADGPTIVPTIENCITTDSPPAIAPTPFLQPHGIGMRFHSFESSTGNPGLVTARLENFTTAGNFPQAVMAPQPALASSDLEGLASSMTRLVEVYASGRTNEHPEESEGSIPIAEVRLDVIGGNWQGHGSPSSGWDLGLWAATESTGISNSDYTCGYSVTLSGTIVDSFNLAGLQGTASATSRGLIQCSGQTIVRNTGIGWTAPPFGSLGHSGILMYGYLGSYLGLVLDQTLIKSNYGNGIWLHSPQGRALKFPTGVYLRATDTGIHANGLDGVAMEAGTPNPAHAGSHGQAIVGGTWELHDGWLSLLDQGNIAVSVPYGVGVINRCSISNNGRHGIRVKVRGRVEDPGMIDDEVSMVACRVVNSIIWNNPQGGVRADLEESFLGSGGPTLLLPIVHCTVIGNGDSSGYNVEVTDASTSFAARFEYATGPSPFLPPTEVVVTRLFDSIFQRKTSSANDFGGHLTTLLIADDADPIAVPDIRIGVEGVRFWPDNHGLGLSIYASIDVLPAMVAGSNPTWSSFDATQFYLTGIMPPPELNSCVTWNLAAPVESMFDHSPWQRTGNLQLRDLGAYQLYPR